MYVLINLFLNLIYIISKQRYEESKITKYVNYKKINRDYRHYRNDKCNSSKNKMNFK